MARMNSEIATDEFDAELERYLALELVGVSGDAGGADGRDDSFVRVRVLKSSPYEVTELVCGKDPRTGEFKNFVQKTIDVRSGIGGAYELLYRAQHNGARLDAVPRIVRCKNVGDELKVTMEFVEGESLDAFAARTGSGLRLACRVFAPLCEAVERLHEGLADADGAVRPLIHRDLKPANIIVQDGGAAGADSRASIKLIDFGIARSWRPGSVADTVKFGTRSYAPPEQFGFGQTDVRSDVYALGAVLYFCLAGKDPEPGKKISALLGESGIAQDLADVIAQAMALDPDDRFANVRELRAAFEDAIHEALLSEQQEGDEASSGVLPGTAGSCSVGPAAASAFGLGDSRKPLLGAQPTLSGGSTLELLSDGGAAEGAVVQAQSSLPQSLPRAALGIAWNFVVALALILVFAGSVSAVLEPTGANERLSRWYLTLEYLGFVDVSAAAIAIGLLDKSRIRIYLPVLDRARGARYIVRVVLLIAVLFLVIVGIGYLTGQAQ